MASKLKVQELALQSPNGLSEATLSVSDSGVVSSNKTVTLASPTITSPTITSPTITSPTITGTTTIAQENWIAPTLLNGWVNYGSGTQTSAYMKDSMGFVHIKGLVKNGSLGNSIFILPSGYRPLEQLHFSTVSNNSFGYFTVETSGGIVVQVGNNAFISLLCTFKAEQ